MYVDLLIKIEGLGSASASPQALQLIYSVRTGPLKPGKSWNFIVAFSRTGKS